MKAIVIAAAAAVLIGGALGAQTVSEWRDPSSHRPTMVSVDREVTLEVLDWGGAGRPLVLLAGLGIRRTSSTSSRRGSRLSAMSMASHAEATADRACRRAATMPIGWRTMCWRCSMRSSWNSRC